MLFRIFFLALVTHSFAVQNKKEVCTLLSICDNIGEIRSEVAALRAEQERQANILEGIAPSKAVSDSGSDTNALASNNNNELCTLLSICNNLAALSSELAAVRMEQERQGDLLEKSCQSDKGHYPANCFEAQIESQKTGVTLIRVPEFSEKPFEVACDQESLGGGWTIILRRTDGSEDFFREWKDYKEGFGQVDNEYFVGLDKLHLLSSSVRQELLILMEDFERQKRYMIYDNFRVGGEANNYTLESLGFPTGNTYDSLTYHLHMQFSTKDRKNDWETLYSCAQHFTGAWWYKSCINSNLAGVYNSTTFGGGINWYSFTGFDKSLKTAIMMIRPRGNSHRG